jgi:3-deoxy-D-manno-octulosonic-acid transferase
MRLLYTLALYLLLPWAMLHLLLRSRRQPAYLQHVAERFGSFAENIRAPVIWIHAVSVGETRAAEPLVKALRERHPRHRILLTHATPTGRQSGIDLFGDSVSRAYLPYDWPFAARRFLGHFRPEIGIIMETEIWPNLIEQSRRIGLPVYLVNARMSEKSARGYARIGGLTRAALRQLAGVTAQTDSDALRLTQLGASKVIVVGNIKFDRSVPPQMMELGTRLRSLFGERRAVFLAASTRDGEEGLILDALARSRLPAELLTVVVPRHPQRFDQVAAMMKQRGLGFRRRSENAVIDGRVGLVLGDSMGEMFAYYAACDVAFIGGSLLPLGGQNLLEACAVGRPVIVGPHTFNFEEATQGAIDAGAALRANDAEDLVAALRALLEDPARRAAMSEAGRQFTDKHRGATERTLALLRFADFRASGS